MRASSYFVLFFVITLGVAAGNLLSNYVTAAVVAYQLNEVTAELKVQAAVAQEKSDRQAAANRSVAEAKRERLLQQQRQSRANGSLGKRLVRECAEWRRSVNDTQSSYAAEQARLSCKKKEQYINTGSWGSKLGS